MKITAFWNSAKHLAGQYAPEIYVGLGIGLSVWSMISAVKATPKVIYEEERFEYENHREPNFKEKLYIYAKHYWPTAITEISSVFFIISGQRIQSKRTAAATAAYVLAQDSLKNFSEKVTEELGTNKVTAIKDIIAKEKMESTPFDESTVIRTGGGDTLCYDAMNGRYFYSSIETIRKAESEMNRRLVRENFISVNDFFTELDLPSVKFGDELGWDVNLEGAVDIEFSSHLDDQDRPCLVIDSDICPRWHLYS